MNGGEENTKDKAHAQMPQEIKEAGIVKTIHGERKYDFWWRSRFPDFKKVRQKGLKGVIEEAKASMEKWILQFMAGTIKLTF